MLEGVGDGLETRGVAGQFEDPGQLEDPEDLQEVVDAARGGSSGVRSRARAGGRLLGLQEVSLEISLKEERDEERQDGENINDIEAVGQELTLGWSSSEPETVHSQHWAVLSSSDLRKYSRVNQAMQMVSIMFSQGFSIRVPSGAWRRRGT